MDALEIIKILIERYDYCGALELMKENGLEKTDAARLMDSCRCAVNFDFVSARKALYGLSDEIKDTENFHQLKSNLDDLNNADPDALFSELLENLKFQIVNEEFIDFLGRVYRFKEAVYKYMFIKAHLQNRRFNFHIRFMQKKEILKILRNHYKIYNHNLIFGINTYFRKYMAENKEVHNIMKILGSEKMNQLIELRHDSLIGHGFKGVSLEEIQKVYGNPYAVLDDFRECLKNLGIKLYRYKYSDINAFICTLLECDNKVSE